MSNIIWKPQVETDAEQLLESLLPSQEEIKNAELEIKILTLLEEVLV